MLGVLSSSYGSGCTVSTVNVIARKYGVFFYGTSGAQALPLHGGLNCVAGARRANSVLFSGGVLGTCTGLFQEDFNRVVASGVDPSLVPGTTMWIQCWSRDPGDPFRDSLSDAVSATILP
jgi:hypothetical protein